jgi:hypothetical protein
MNLCRSTAPLKIGGSRRGARSPDCPSAVAGGGSPLPAWFIPRLLIDRVVSKRLVAPTERVSVLFAILTHDADTEFENGSIRDYNDFV